ARAGDLIAADERFQTLLADEEGGGTIWRFRAAREVGLLRLGAGRVREATTALLRAELLRGEDTLVLAGLGRAWLIQGDTRRAVEPLEKAAVQLREQATPRFWLALAYSMQGRDEDAAREIERGQELDPDWMRR